MVYFKKINNRVYVALADQQMTLEDYGAADNISGMKRVFHYSTDDKIVELRFDDGSTYKMPVKEAAGITKAYDDTLHKVADFKQEISDDNP